MISRRVQGGAYPSRKRGEQRKLTSRGVGQLYFSLLLAASVDAPAVSMILLALIEGAVRADLRSSGAERGTRLDLLPQVQVTVFPCISDEWLLSSCFPLRNFEGAQSSRPLFRQGKAQVLSDRHAK